MEIERSVPHGDREVADIVEEHPCLDERAPWNGAGFGA